MNRFAVFCFLLASPAFGVKIQGIDVQIGHDGTDDTPVVRVCGVYPNGTFGCCTTNTLNSGWTNDWSRNGHEVWKGSKWLGTCMNIEFKTRWLEVAIKKTGDDGFLLDNVSLLTDSGTFDCGAIYFGGGPSAGRVDNYGARRNYCFNV